MITCGRERWLLRERGVNVAALEHLFQGSALNAVDAKGRVSVPAFLRTVVERRGDARTITLAKHEAFPCLSAYDPAYAALFLGTGETFQVWNPQLLLDDPRIPDDLKDIARFRLEERGVS